MEYTPYNTEQVKERILLRFQELEEKIRVEHPNSFFAKTYPSRRSRYLELLGRLERGEQLSAFVMSRLFHRGARHVID